MGQNQTVSMPYDERDADSGKFTPEFPDSAFLDVLLERDQGATTREVADAVGCKYRTAHARLGDLEDEGRVSSRKIGASLLWTAVESVPRDAPDTAGREAPVEPSVSTAGGRPGAADGRDDVAPRDDDALVALRAADELPSTVDEDDAADAVRAVVEYLRDEGPASMREIVVDVMPDVPLSYDPPGSLEPGERYRGAWWRRVVKPALAEHPAVEYRDGHGDYRYIGASEEGRGR